MSENTLTWASVAPAVGEMYLAFAICLVLMVDVFVGEKRKGFTATFTMIVLAVGALLLALYGHVPTRTVLFHGMYVADELAFVLKLVGYLVVAFALLYSRTYLENRGAS